MLIFHVPLLLHVSLISGCGGKLNDSKQIAPQTDTQCKQHSLVHRVFFLIGICNSKPAMQKALQLQLPTPNPLF